MGAVIFNILHVDAKRAVASEKAVVGQLLFKLGERCSVAQRLVVFDVNNAAAR